MSAPATEPAKCSRCGNARAWSVRRRNGATTQEAVCRHCNRQSQAKHRAKHGGAASRNRIWESKNREKALAHRKVEGHLKRGNIAKQPCERCGSTDVEAHHDDYRRALEIKWLCPKHHAERHLELKAMAESEAA